MIDGRHRPGLEMNTLGDRLFPEVTWVAVLAGPTRYRFSRGTISATTSSGARPSVTTVAVATSA